MKSLILLFLLCLLAILAICFPSCSFLEDSPVQHSHDNLACYSFLCCRAGTSSSSSTGVKTLDIFVYDTFGSGPLDSYEHLDLNGGENSGPLPELLEISSSSGQKNVVVVANMKTSNLSYKEITSYGQFKLMLSSLYDECASYPVLAGECRLKAGPDTSHDITLLPICSRIQIRNFEVDFSDRPYADRTLENVKAYIVNANASCGFLSCEPAVATDFINFRGLDQSCLSSMKSPELLYHQGSELRGCQLFCYPCTEGPGGNEYPTMLVIEGTIEGNKYYYPLLVGDGIVRRANDYVFDIKITRLGALSADEPIRNEDIDVQLNIIKWKEYAWETVDY